MLLDFLPLARVCNSVLASLNAIRLCAPVSLAGFVAASLNSLLADCAGRLAAHYALFQTTWGDTQRRGYLQLCSAFKRLLLPYLAKCLSAVFPPRDMAAISGLAVSDLLARGLGFLDTIAVLGPLADLLRPLDEEEAAVVADRAKSLAVSAAQQDALKPDVDSTEYVADKMAELAAAVDDATESSPASSAEGNFAENEERIEELGEIAEQQQDEEPLAADPQELTGVSGHESPLEIAGEPNNN